MSTRPIPVPERSRTPAPSLSGAGRAPMGNVAPILPSTAGGVSVVSLSLKLAAWIFVGMGWAALGPFLLPVNESPMWLGGYIASVVVVGVGAAAYFWLNIVGTIAQVTQHTEVFASGDLTRLVPAPRRWVHDETIELTSAINRMLGSLRELVARIQISAEAVAASADQVSNAAENASGSAHQIAVKIEEIGAGSDRQKQLAEGTQQKVREIAKSLSTVAGGARAASESAARAEQAAHDGRHLSRTTLDKLKLVFERLEHSSVEVGRFGEKSAEIEKIVGVITNISSQTNLLALNATIEAARAGEAGRGFAVVAEEVRKLAESSAKAAEQIATLIEDVREESRRVIEAVQESVRTIAEGHTDLSAIGQTIDRIATDVQAAAAKVRDIRESTEEVSSDAKSLVDAADAISGLARSNAVATERVVGAVEEQSARLKEMANSSATLNNLSVEMQRASGNFRL